MFLNGNRGNGFQLFRRMVKGRGAENIEKKKKADRRKTLEKEKKRKTKNIRKAK